MADPDADAERLDGGHPYTARALVRRPRDPARLNGTGIVAWLSVSAGQDVDVVYAAPRALILREGYAWVGTSVQRVGVECLVACPGRLARDAEGRTVGGVRFAAYEVPVSIHVGVSDTGPRIAGYHLDFTPEDMARCHGTLAAYLEKVAAAVEINVVQEFLLAEDAVRAIAEARFEG